MAPPHGTIPVALFCPTLNSRCYFSWLFVAGSLPASPTRVEALAKNWLCVPRSGHCRILRIQSRTARHWHRVIAKRFRALLPLDGQEGAPEHMMRPLQPRCSHPPQSRICPGRGLLKAQLTFGCSSSGRKREKTTQTWVPIRRRKMASSVLYKWPCGHTALCTHWFCHS